jgi:plastocyanin
MKRSAVVALPLLLLVVVAAGCGKPSSPTSSGGGNTVGMGASNFEVSSITIKAGQSVHFDDSSGGYHVICLGTDQACDQTATGPAELMGQGFVINAPQTKDVVFADAGTFKVTCTVHPNMNLTVTVTAS